MPPASNGPWRKLSATNTTGGLFPAAKPPVAVTLPNSETLNPLVVGGFLLVFRHHPDAPLPLLAANNGIVGTIPDNFDFSSPLQYLSLRGNELEGTVPSTLGLAPELTTLDVSGNALTGAIPGNLGRPFTLRFLHLGFNQLSGGGHGPSAGGAANRCWATNAPLLICSYIRARIAIGFSP